MKSANISIVISCLFGILVLIRTNFKNATRLRALFICKSQYLFLILLIENILTVLFFQSWLFCLANLMILNLISLIFPLWLENFCEKKLEQLIPHFLNQIILQMRLGNSLQSSFMIVYEQSDAFVQQMLRSIKEFVFFSQHKQVFRSHSALLKEIFEEFSDLQSFPARNLLRLQGWRRCLRLRHDFCQKIGQATLQVRTQILLMSGLYFALLLFLWNQGVLREHKALMFGSMVLFFIGCAMQIFMNARYKWKT